MCTWPVSGNWVFQFSEDFSWISRQIKSLLCIFLLEKKNTKISNRRATEHAQTRLLARSLSWGGDDGGGSSLPHEQMEEEVKRTRRRRQPPTFSAGSSRLTAPCEQEGRGYRVLRHKRGPLDFGSPLCSWLPSDGTEPSTRTSGSLCLEFSFM